MSNIYGKLHRDKLIIFSDMLKACNGEIISVISRKSKIGNYALNRYVNDLCNAGLCESRNIDTNSGYRIGYFITDKGRQYVQLIDQIRGLLDVP